jgi:hypothetical protein
VDERISLREWEPADLKATHADDVRDAFVRLKGELLPSPELATFAGNRITVQNMIGTARLRSGAIIDVEPKISVDTQWAESVAQLITRDTRIAVTGSQRSKHSPKRNDLSSAIANEYALRLERVLRQDGPIQIYEHHRIVSRRLNGHLNVSKWVRSNILNPAIFPVERDEFTVANDFNRGLSMVCGLFLRSALNGGLAARLRRLETSILPGHPLPVFINPSVASRTLPSQWSRYQPAWDIAAAVLRNRSVVGDPGHTAGLEVALEPWPLLETLLERALKTLAKMKVDEGYEFVPKTSYPLLTSEGRDAQKVEPDGLLMREGSVLATFEAKYTRAGATPERAHSFQALSTAAALHSPLAIITYPGDGPTQIFAVEGFQGKPARLATVGLSMFTYKSRGRGGVGDEGVARIIDDIVIRSKKEMSVSREN